MSVSTIKNRAISDPLICPIATYQCYVAQLASSTLTSVKHPYLDQTLNPLIRYMFDINQAASSDTIGRYITKVSDLLPLPRAWKRRRLVALLASPWPLSMVLLLTRCRPKALGRIRRRMVLSIACLTGPSKT